jgi:hypothetical protein
MGGLMTTRFGYGFERKSANSPSTQHAQGFFLKILPQLKKEVMISLFDAAQIPFRDFLSNHQDEILSIKSRIEPAPFSMDTATRIFIHSWSALQQEKLPDQLCLALREWACKWNLNNDWCLNHAVLALRDQSWDGALFWLETEPIFSQYELTKELEKALAEFTFNYEKVHITVEGPFFKPPAQFTEDVKRSFAASGGPTVRGARKALGFELRIYLDKVAKAKKSLKLSSPPVRWTPNHFEWLISYQVGHMTYREIGRTFDKDEATVREGTKNLARLVGLKLRCAEHPGRPKGINETATRRRATKSR